MQDNALRQRIYYEANKERLRKKQNLYKKNWRLQHPDLARIRDSKHHEKYKKKRSEYAVAYKKKNPPDPLKVAARNLLNVAVRLRKIKKPKNCTVCGLKGKIQGHHHDYTKPLDVKWLCIRCHVAEHFESRVALSAVLKELE